MYSECGFTVNVGMHVSECVGGVCTCVWGVCGYTMSMGLHGIMCM